MSNPERMSKPTLFIGSSTEAKWLMSKITTNLFKYCDVKPWDKDIFRVGTTTLEVLRREVLLSDFALLILYPDDKILKRNKKGYAPRDNILFELGLFMGVLGRKRSFWLSVTDKRGRRSKKILIPSDLASLTRLDITIEDKKTTVDQELQRVCNEIKEAMEREENSRSFTLLPSTALAMGYYQNFVLGVCKALLKKKFKIDGKNYDLTRGNFIFNIVLPNKGSEAGHAGYEAFIRNRGYRKVEIKGEARSFPFFIDSIPQNGKIILYDYPTTLRASMEAINSISQNENISNNEREIMERREIVNFGRTLHQLLETSNEASNIRDKVLIISLDKIMSTIS